MPRGMRPMLARLAKMPPNEQRFGFEIKWDGVRALAYAAGGKMRLESRTGREISAQFPEAAGLGRALGRRQAVLDSSGFRAGSISPPRRRSRNGSPRPR
jgi:bifunctional non-homologous end joining protein LigD